MLLRSTLWPTMLLAAIACTGAIDTPRGPVDGTERGNANHPAGRSGDLPGGSVAALCAEPSVVDVDTSPLRRLTHEEYNHTIRDLFGITRDVASPFPADEAFGGFAANNRTAVTQLSVERYQEVAEQLATEVSLAPWLACPRDSQTLDCATSFVRAFGRRALRRPLSDEEVEALVSMFVERQQRSDFDQGIRLVISALLQSPSFLYRPEVGDGSASSVRPIGDYELASRLSYFIWTSAPDDALLDAAGSGALQTPEGLRDTISSMLADPKAEDGIASFHRQWLGVDRLETLSKDEVLFPSFTNSLKAAMLEETSTFVADVLLHGDGRAIASKVT